MDDYETLKACGHSPAAAAAIIIGSRKGAPLCTKWMKAARAEQDRAFLDTTVTAEGLEWLMAEGMR